VHESLGLISSTGRKKNEAEILKCSSRKSMRHVYFE
jgi:hypothetical protein